jgi:hypothetical protein
MAERKFRRVFYGEMEISAETNAIARAKIIRRKGFSVTHLSHSFICPVI